MTNKKLSVNEIRNICEITVGLILGVLASSAGLSINLKKIPNVVKVYDELTSLTLQSAIVSGVDTAENIFFVSVTSVFVSKGVKDMKIITPAAIELLHIYKSNTIIYPESLIRSLKSLNIYDFDKLHEEIMNRFK